MRVVVVALGKIGLPLAAKIAMAGHEVIGCDVNARVVELVNDAREPFPGEAGLADALAELVPAGRLTAQTDTAAAVASAPDVVIAVPPLVVDAHAQPDFRVLDSVTDAIGNGLQAAGREQRGMVISVETTIPVGTTRDRIAPRLALKSGRIAERDFFVVHSPERVFSGRIFQDLDSYPKLVGGLSPEGEAAAIAAYESFLPGVEVRGMGSAEAAELTKLAETTYRDVNIALANEFAVFADTRGIDVQAVIDAANSQPFSHIHRPGIAVGGHCIPVYPRFYLAGHPDAALPASSREVNEGMPGYAVDRLADALAGAPRGSSESSASEALSGRSVLILGVTYRGDVKETAFSGAFGVRDALLAHDAVPLAADPLYTSEELRALGFAPWDGGPIDAAIVQADHALYRMLTPEDVPGAYVVLDGRGVIDPEAFLAEGIRVVRIGRPELDPA